MYKIITVYQRAEESVIVPGNVGSAVPFSALAQTLAFHLMV